MNGIDATRRASLELADRLMHRHTFNTIATLVWSLIEINTRREWNVPKKLFLSFAVLAVLLPVGPLR
jgi:hypothetical protein